MDAAQIACDRLVTLPGIQHVWICWSLSETPYQQLACASVGETGHECMVSKQLLLATAEETHLGNRLVELPHAAGAASHGQAIAQQLLGDLLDNERTDASQLIALPLGPPDDQESNGVIVIAGNDLPRSRELMSLLGPLLGSRFKNIERSEQQRNPFHRQRIQSWLRRRRTAVIAGMITSLGLLLCLPVTHRLHIPCQLEPVRRRFVAAPFDAPLQKIHVRPGDSVKAGQVLAEIDTERLLSQMAAAESELRHATAQRSHALASHDTVAAQLHAFEMDKARSRIEHLNHLVDRSRVTSPIEGIVVMGDWKSREGVPLEMGETLFEVAPLDAMRVRMEVAQTDYELLANDMSAKIRLLAAGQNDYATAIDWIHPRAERLRDDHLFVAEATVANHEGVLRPGMRGTATVMAGTRSLGWVLMRGPIRWMRETFVW